MAQQWQAAQTRRHPGKCLIGLPLSKLYDRDQFADSLLAAHLLGNWIYAAAILCRAA